MENFIYNLDCRFDRRASFYGKAKVEVLPNGDKRLYSYGTLVAEVRGGEYVSLGKWSKTTSRHQREFARQEGFDNI